MSKHQVNQRELPIVFAGAGPPQLPSLTSEAQTYAERMFAWPEIGRLPDNEARTALAVPARESGAEFEPAALDAIIDYTEGYPFFLQEYGKAVWNLAATSPITLVDTLAARDVVDAVLDQDFFSLRVGNLPDRELDYVKALAALGPGEHTPADIAKAMGATSSATIGSFSRRLTERGLISSTKRGRVAFTVPQFDRYVARALAPHAANPAGGIQRPKALPALGCQQQFRRTIFKINTSDKRSSVRLANQGPAEQRQPGGRAMTRLSHPKSLTTVNMWRLSKARRSAAGCGD